MPSQPSPTNQRHHMPDLVGERPELMANVLAHITTVPPEPRFTFRYTPFAMRGLLHKQQHDQSSSHSLEQPPTWPVPKQHQPLTARKHDGHNAVKRSCHKATWQITSQSMPRKNLVQMQPPWPAPKPRRQPATPWCAGNRGVTLSDCSFANDLPDNPRQTAIEVAVPQWNAPSA